MVLGGVRGPRAYRRPAHGKQGAESKPKPRYPRTTCTAPVLFLNLFREVCDNVRYAVVHTGIEKRLCCYWEALAALCDVRY
eukprot:2619210-Rhodomonas_salina.1